VKLPRRARRDAVLATRDAGFATGMRAHGARPQWKRPGHDRTKCDTQGGRRRTSFVEQFAPFRAFVQIDDMAGSCQVAWKDSPRVPERRAAGFRAPRRHPDGVRTAGALPRRPRVAGPRRPPPARPGPPLPASASSSPSPTARGSPACAHPLTSTAPRGTNTSPRCGVTRCGSAPGGGSGWTRSRTSSTTTRGRRPRSARSHSRSCAPWMRTGTCPGGAAAQPGCGTGSPA